MYYILNCNGGSVWLTTTVAKGNTRFWFDKLHMQVLCLNVTTVNQEKIKLAEISILCKSPLGIFFVLDQLEIGAKV